MIGGLFAALFAPGRWLIKTKEALEKKAPELSDKLVVSQIQNAFSAYAAASSSNIKPQQLAQRPAQLASAARPA